MENRKIKVGDYIIYESKNDKPPILHKIIAVHSENSNLVKINDNFEYWLPIDSKYYSACYAPRIATKQEIILYAKD